LEDTICQNKVFWINILPSLESETNASGLQKSHFVEPQDFAQMVQRKDTDFIFKQGHSNSQSPCDYLNEIKGLLDYAYYGLSERNRALWLTVSQREIKAWTNIKTMGGYRCLMESHEILVSAELTSDGVQSGGIEFGQIRQMASEKIVNFSNLQSSLLLVWSETHKKAIFCKDYDKFLVVWTATSMKAASQGKKVILGRFLKIINSNCPGCEKGVKTDYVWPENPIEIHQTDQEIFHPMVKL
jgi:hypothetical protein